MSEWTTKQRKISEKRRKSIEHAVTPDGCWECTSHGDNGYGYPVITRDGRTEVMHRYIYKRDVGIIPEGMVVRHKCDNRKCINPDHLELGTKQDNMDDMKERKRHRVRGRIDGDTRRAICESPLRTGLASMHFGVAPSTIRSIRKQGGWV